jgi:hypothetical protein
MDRNSERRQSLGIIEIYEQLQRNMFMWLMNLQDEAETADVFLTDPCLSSLAFVFLQMNALYRIYSRIFCIFYSDVLRNNNKELT